MQKNKKKVLTIPKKDSILDNVESNGRLAQLGEHLPYKQGVIGSSPITTTIIFIRPGSSVG